MRRDLNFWIAVLVMSQASLVVAEIEPCSEFVPHLTFEDGKDFHRAMRACLSHRYCTFKDHGVYVYGAHFEEGNCKPAHIPNWEFPNSPNDPGDNWCCP